MFPGNFIRCAVGVILMMVILPSWIPSSVQVSDHFMATIGAGVIILIVLWVVALFAAGVFIWAQGPVKFVGIALVLVVAIVTIILLTIERKPLNETSSDIVLYDLYFIARVTILIFMCVMCIVGGLLYVLFHGFEMRQSPVAKMYKLKYS